MASKDSLDSFRLSVRLLILQELTLRSFAGVTFLLEQDNDLAKRQTIAVLESSAENAEHHFLSSSSFGPMSAEERALYADEVREIIDEMKASVNTYFRNKTVAEKR
jgi:hypothetical protein